MRTCSICENEHLARGYCTKHYSYLKRKGHLKNKVKVQKSCSIPDCKRKYSSLGYCGTHYEYYRKHGYPVPIEKTMSDYDNSFWSKVSKTNGCWEWTAGKRMGYGQFRYKNRMMNAHRWSYTRLVGEIPTGLYLDHLCRNRACVNPNHLEPVTNRENCYRGKRGILKKSGLPVGVYRTPKGRYGVVKGWERKAYYLGTYDTPEEGSVVYQTAVML